MIKFDEVFCLDLKDDFEEAGRGGRNFSLYDFLEGDLDKAFAFGFSHIDWIQEKMWFPTTVRKELRHISDGLEEYNPQLQWLNEKYAKTNVLGSQVLIKHYVDFIIDNIFCDDPNVLLRLVFMLGTNLGISEKQRTKEEKK